MEEIYAQIQYYVRAVWQRRWLVLGAAFMIAAAGWAAVATLPDIYRSSARIYVDTGNVLTPLLRGLAVGDNTQRQLRVIRRTLVSKPNLEEIARRTDLDITATTDLEKEALLSRLESAITIRSSRENIFDISYTGQNPVLARDVVDALTTLFVENNLGENRSEIDNAQEFLRGQLEQYAAKLDEAEYRLAQFRQENFAFLPGQQGFQQQLNEALNELARLQATLQDAETRKTVLEESLAETPRMISQGGGALGPPTNLEVQIIQLQGQLEELSARYTEQHPDVILLQRRLDRLYEQQEAGGPASFVPAPAGEGGASLPNPVYTDLQLELIQQESAIRTLYPQIERAEQRVATIRERLERVPDVEADLKRLTRDYTVIQKNYQTLLERRESARISSDREQLGTRMAFRIIEAAQVPNKPTGPNRPILLLGVLAVGLGAGVAAALGLALLNITYATTEQLASDFQLPILGSVMFRESERRRSRPALNIASLAVALGVLLVVLLGLIVVESRLPLETYQLISFMVGGLLFLLGALTTVLALRQGKPRLAPAAPNQEPALAMAA